MEENIKDNKEDNKLKPTKLQRLELWEKRVEIFNKIIISILISAITSILAWRSNLITDAINKGELELKKLEYQYKILDELIKDTTTNTKYMHQDIALAILYDNLRNDDTRKDFLINVTQIILSDTSKINNDIPFKIIFELDPKKGREFQYKFSNTQIERKLLNISLSELSDTNKLPDIKEIDTAKFNSFEKINRIVGKQTIYIQINRVGLNDKAEDLRQKLLDYGYLVPPIEVVTGNYDNNIRYFNSQDLTISNDILNKLELENVRILNLSHSNKFKAPNGQIELWLSSL